VAPSSLRLIDQHPDTKIICNDCVEGVVATSGEPVKVLPVDEREARATAADEAAYQARLRYWKRRLRAK
jgi:hypothetical protein